MKKQVTTDQTFCDFCQTNTAYEKCLRCSKDACWQCQDKHGVKYNHGVYAGGSGDGFYCTPCDVALSESKSDPTHQAYVAVRALRDENEAWAAAFKSRQITAEAEVLRLYYEREKDAMPL